MARKIERRNIPLGVRLTPSAVANLRAASQQFEMAINEVLDRLLTRPLEELGEQLVAAVAAPTIEVAPRGNPAWVAMQGRRFRDAKHLARVTGRKGVRGGKA